MSSGGDGRNGHGEPRESPPPLQRQGVLGGPTIRVVIEMQVQGLAAHFEEAVRLAPGSTDSHAEIVADVARRATHELAKYLAVARVSAPGKEG